MLEGEQTQHEFSLIGDKFWYKRRIMIPANSPISQALLKEYRDSPIGGTQVNSKLTYV